MAKDGTPRVLIVRLSHIGDAVLTVPLAYHLRACWPQAYIAWAAERAAAGVLKQHPAVDEVIEVPRQWMRRMGQWIAWRRLLRARTFDIALDPQSLLKSAALAWLSGAPIRVGFSGKHGREGSPWLNNRHVKPQTSHLVDRTLELLLPLGLTPPTSPRLDLPVSDAARRVIAPFLQSLGGNPYVVINPGAGWASRRWPTDRFRLVSQWFQREMSWRSVVVWAGEAERALAETIVAASDGTACLAPATGLEELMALLASSVLYFGDDTGPMHLANAVGVRCVGLYGPTRPEDSGAYGPQHLAITSPMVDESNRKNRRNSMAAIESIHVDDVCKALTSFLYQPAQQADKLAG